MADLVKLTHPDRGAALELDKPHFIEVEVETWIACGIIIERLLGLLNRGSECHGGKGQKGEEIVHGGGG
jgi:hypothetical protein